MSKQLQFRRLQKLPAGGGKRISKTGLLLSGLLIFASFELGKYIGHHLVAAILILVFTSALIMLAVRPVSELVNRFGARFIVRSWNPHHPAPAPEPRQRERALPEPLGQGVPGQPFFSSPARAAWTSAPAPGTCEGPGCMIILPLDTDARWRCGTGPVIGPEDRRAVQIGDTHEFCSEACMDAWIKADEAKQAGA